MLLTIISCSTKSAPQSKTENKNNEITLTDAQLASIGISYAQIESKIVSELINLSGKIDVPPQNMVTVSVPLGGYVKNTHLLPGMYVKKGESIAEIEGQQYIQLQQEYLTTQAKLAYLEKEFERQKTLNEAKAGSDKAFQQTETEYKTMKIDLKALQEKLKLIGVNPETLNDLNLAKSIRIISPIDGYVSKVNVNIGKYVNSTDVLFELVNPDDIHLALHVFEKDIDKLSIGQKVWANTNSNPTKRFPCHIILIGKDVSADKSVVVHCHFDKYDHSLIPGLYMNAQIELSNSEVETLSDECIVQFDDKNYVLVQKSEKVFQLLEIKTGIKENGYTSIIDAEKLKGLKIVRKGAYQLLMAMKNQGDN
jgi:cobalt-zinc-cadmium efflux system membrane fusion protein